MENGQHVCQYHKEGSRSSERGGAKQMIGAPQKLVPSLILALVGVLLASLISWQGSVQIQKASAVTADAGIGVYWDSALTNSCRSISWGQLNPGGKKTRVIYLRNERSEAIHYLMRTEQWNPTNASGYINLEWDYNGIRAISSSVQRVSLTITVQPTARGIVNFSFNTVILGNPYLWGDVDHDMNVDIRDLGIITRASGSSPESLNWNAEADINADGQVDVKDLAIATKNFGRTSA